MTAGTRGLTALAVRLLFLALGATSACAAPPFGVRLQGGAWQLVTPTGKPFFSRGVCCVNMGIERAKYNAQKPGYAAWRQYPDEAQWADATVQRLKSWGFTTIGGWSDIARLRRSQRMDLAFTLVLHIGSSSGAPWFDMWDPKVIRTMETVARDQILPIRDDPRLMGYYTDNEMGWWNGALFKMTLEQPARSGQRQRLMRLLRAQYHNNWNRLRRDFVPQGAASFPDLDRRGVLFLRPGGQGIHAVRRFLGLAAERYYQLTRQVIRKYDRRALILGDRYQSFYYPEVARASGRSVDAVSTNLNAHWNDGTFLRFYLDTLHALSSKPVMIGEFYMTAVENRSGNKNGSSGFPVVQTQQERAEGFRTTLSTLQRLPFVIGADWFQYYDEPTFGRDDGEDYDMGLVDINDQPYAEITRAAATFARARPWTAPPARRPNASTGIPPAPGDPMAELKPMLALKQWDRERGFVPPTSRFPVADLYACWDAEAVYLGLYAMDTVEETYYRDRKVPEVDRIEWRLRLPGRAQPIRVHLGAGRQPSVAGGGVSVRSVPGGIGDTRHIAVMRVPAALLGCQRLRAADPIPFSSALLTHGRAYRVDWGGKFRLAE